MSPTPVLKTLDQLWDQYSTSAATTSSATKPVLKPATSEPLKGRTYYELKYDDISLETLKYTVELHGQQPSDGYPLFIGFHGGGGPTRDSPDAKSSNDSQWQDMSGYYIKSIKAYLPSGVYIAARGIVDTWDLHIRPKSYYLLRRLVRNLLLKSPVEAQADLSKLNASAKHFINPNRVYILGFSAGGDGVYRLGSFLSDSLAAVNMSAGHPGAVKLGNYANTPLCLQVGEEDGDSKIQTNGLRFNESNRNIRTVEVGLTLNSLKQANTGYYTHDVFMHPTKQLSGWAHNSWSSDELSQGDHPIIQNWPAFTRPETVATTAGTGPTCAVLWVKEHERKPLPNLVIWDPSKPTLEDNPLYPSEWTVSTAISYRFRYWLAVEAADTDALTPGPVPPNADPKQYFVDKKNQIVVQYTKDPSEVWVKQTPVKLVIFLNDKMVNNIGEPVKVFWGSELGTRRLVWNGIVNHVVATQEATLRMRGDPDFVFSAALHFDPSGSGSVRDGNAVRAML